MVRFLIVALLSLMMGGAAFAVDSVNVKAFDPISNQYKPVKGIDLGGGLVGLAISSGGGPATDVTIVGSTLGLGTGMFVRLSDGIHQALFTTEGRVKTTLRVPNVFTTLPVVSCLTTATILFSGDPTEAATEDYIISGFNVTTATVYIGDSAVTPSTGIPIVVGSPPVVIHSHAPLYCIVDGPGHQDVRKARNAHSVAP